ncbi:acyl-CoA dehydrogenase [Endozoicomonas sp. GU-1]|uniref:acyl-CoA dehydrogenase family protein n=1 Tax=Endozoicomonas sp. GU-1 TaxID=3009078 RepID=UPI0022B4D14B|nr:acyl-CoA dehydrogenase [Endozoicomonas sp. GU-1]WBA80308.1 acyl-CoA dehydrogenase [Endozoicomonas sp. GU-1]WBA87879.1 acyl-CoA dehydrogenase [Endozoicomonas sp. GU-1]
MNFSYSDEQKMLQDSVAKFVQQDYDFDHRRQLVDSATGFSNDHWQLFAELGWLMVPFTEADGGLGGSAVDLMIVMEAFGKGMVVEPFLASAILGGGLIAATGNEAQKEELLGVLMEGRLQLAFAFAEPQSRYNLADVAMTGASGDDSYTLNGQKSVVLNAPAADYLIVAVRTTGAQLDVDGISLLLVDSQTAGIDIRDYTTVDGHRAAEVSFTDVKVPASNLLGAEGKALPVIEQMIDRASLALCAEAVGAMEVAYKKTVEYTRTRKQFGVPIARFQALQHRMADMFIEYEQARSILIMAAMQLDANQGIAPKAVSAAKSRVGKAARLIGQEAVQLHGGIGVTDELDVGHLFKRLTTIQYLFGSTDFHTQRFAAAE